MTIEKITPSSFRSITWEKRGEPYGHVLGRATDSDTWVLDYTKKGEKPSRNRSYCAICPKYISSTDAQRIIFDVIANSTKANNVKINYYA